MESDVIKLNIDGREVKGKGGRQFLKLRMSMAYTSRPSVIIQKSARLVHAVFVSSG